MNLDRNNSNLNKLIELLDYYKSRHSLYDRLEFFVSFLRIFRLWSSSKRMLKDLKSDLDWDSVIDSLLNLSTIPFFKDTTGIRICINEYVSDSLLNYPIDGDNVTVILN